MLAARIAAGRRFRRNRRRNRRPAGAIIQY
eukprot:COSAG05_NODE_3557_length_1992_cov_2.217116_1_plen_29_part_10